MLLNTKEVSLRLGYTQRNVAYLVAHGKLKPINPHHKKGFLFDSKEIDLFNSKKVNKND